MTDIRVGAGDLLGADAEALVNPVNTEGVMGAGLALTFKHAFPANYVAYRRACQRGDVAAGRVLAFDAGAQRTPRWIINFPTKTHWRLPSQLAYISSGLDDLRETVQRLHICSIAVPALGCGFGGLGWRDVRPLIATRLADLDLVLWLYGPQPPPRRRP